MKYVELGKTGLTVSVLGMGAVQIGRPAVSEREAEAVIRTMLELGINFVDTAAMYKLSEERLGRYLEKHRDKVIVATKCGDYNVVEDGQFRTVKDYTRSGVLRTIDRSRMKLRADRIDIVQFHGLPADRGQRREAIEALLEAREKGWVRFVGVSMDATPGADDDLWKPDVQEFTYNVLQQEADATILPAMMDRGIGTIIKCPIANAVYLMKERPDGTYFADSWDRAQRMDVRALAGSIPPAEFALRFTLSHPGVHTAIVGATRCENMAANAKAVDRGPLPEALIREAKLCFNQVFRTGTHA